MELHEMEERLDSFISKWWGTLSADEIYKKRRNIRDDDYNSIYKLYKEYEHLIAE